MRLLVRWMGLSVESAYDKVKKVYKRIIIILLVNQGWRCARWWQYGKNSSGSNFNPSISSSLSWHVINIINPQISSFCHYYFYHHTQVAMCQMSNSNSWNWLRFVTRWDNNINRNIWMIHIIFFHFCQMYLYCLCIFHFCDM